ncbi:MAG: hypothetical protein JNG82_11400 [Opitutaceae bacterium]|nr:hypothetical protein [Opitutaceae bacterium]
MKSRFLLLVLMFLALAGAAWSAAADSPVSLVLTYKARPEARADFLAWVETAGAARFAAWKAGGVFSDAQLLFSTFPSSANPDLVAILDFPNLAASARWREIERRSPGELTQEALRLAVVESGNYGEILSRAVAAKRDPARAAYLVVTYATHVSAAEYAKYVLGYTVPLMKE